MKPLAAITFAVLLGAVSADARTFRIICRDGVSRTPNPRASLSTPPIVCDADGVCNGECVFASFCPVCTFAERSCLVPCGPDLRTIATVSVGKRHTVKSRSVKLKLRCLPAPASASCATPTTTTTRPPRIAPPHY